MANSSEAPPGYPELVSFLQADRPVSPVGFYDTLTEAGELLADAGLGHIRQFTQPYGALTWKVHEGLQKSRFENPELTELLVCDFGDWFLSALQSYATGTGKPPPPAWRRFFEMRADPGEPDEKRPKGLFFTAGMIAHILNDLPQSVDRVGADTGYRQDFFTVDSVIEDIAYRLTPAFVPPPSPLRWGATALANVYIGSMRRTAWRDYQRLRWAESYGGSDAKASVVKMIEVRAEAAHLALMTTKSLGTLAIQTFKRAGLKPIEFPTHEELFQEAA